MKLRVPRFKIQDSGLKTRVSRFTFHEKGFTLLESIVAIAVFTIGISTAMSVISSSLSVGTRTKDKIIASNLAQEGIEVVHSIRDNNWISGLAWDTGIVSGCVQWDSASVISCGSSSNLVFNGALTPPVYELTSAPSKFSRTITVATDALYPERMEIVSDVNCGLNCSVSLSEYLYNWK